ncbi:MAG: hypothetical protein IH624_14765 [Phycisphaerae bacterium]|nr:hypothetical protein [Phycisphaerae bacterium]
MSKRHTTLLILGMTLGHLSFASRVAKAGCSELDCPVGWGEHLADGLVGYWRLGRYSGATVPDSSGDASTRLLTNGPTWTGTAPAGCTVYLTDRQRLTCRAGTNKVVSNTDILRHYKWQHVAVIHDTENTLTLYVEGQPSGTAVDDIEKKPADATNAPVTIGNTVLLDCSFTGMLKDAEEIATIIRTLRVRESKIVSFQLATEDAAGHTVAYALHAGQVLPAGASFAAGKFFWRPWYGQAGTYNLTFELPGHPDLTQPVRIDVDKVPISSWYRKWLHCPSVISAPDE